MLLKRLINTSNSKIKAPLEGIRILDLTRVLAGPYCSMILGDLGAEVIKVEEPSKGDDTRSWGPPLTSTGHSAYFLAINRNKKSLTLNMKSKKASEILRDLVRKSDVVIENFVPGNQLLENLNCSWECARELNKSLIWASITGYGPSGPYAKKAGYDVIIEAEGGLMHCTGEPDGEPVKVGVAMIDLVTGLYAHGAIMAALLSREKTGQGQRIDLSLLESQMATLVNIGSNYLIGNQEAQRMGTSHASIVPYQAFMTKDSRIVVGAGNDRQFQKLCALLDIPEIARDPKYIDNQNRVKNRDKLIRILSQKFREHKTDYWIEKLDGSSGLPFGPVNTIAQAMNHPQVLHRDMIVELEHPTIGKFKSVGLPVKYSNHGSSIRSPPPTLGEHTEQILRDLLKYDADSISSLRRKNVI